MKERVIWQNYDFNVKDWKDDFIMEKEDNDALSNYLIEHDYKIDDEDVLEWARETNDMYLDDERMNLNVKVGMPIIVIADLGLWDGRHIGYKIIESGNISDCLHDSDCEYCKWYCDENDFCFTGSHHDGTNNYVYRAISRENIGLLEDGEISFSTKEDIEKYTQSIRQYIADVYWG